MSISTLPSAQSSTLNVFWKGDNKFQKQVPGEKRTLASVYSIGLNFPTHTLTAEVPPQLLSRDWTVLSMKVQAESESTDHITYPCSCDTLAATQKVIITILHFHEDFRYPGQFIPNAQPHPFAINIKPNTICFEPGSQYGLYVSLGINGFEASFGVIKDSKDQSHGAIQTPVLIKQPKLPAPVVDPRCGLAAVASALPIGVSIVCAPHQTLKVAPIVIQPPRNTAIAAALPIGVSIVRAPTQRVLTSAPIAIQPPQKIETVSYTDVLQKLVRVLDLPDLDQEAAWETLEDHVLEYILDEDEETPLKLESILKKHDYSVLIQLLRLANASVYAKTGPLKKLEDWLVDRLRIKINVLRLQIVEDFKHNLESVLCYVLVGDVCDKSSVCCIEQDPELKKKKLEEIDALALIYTSDQCAKFLKELRELLI